MRSLGTVVNGVKDGSCNAGLCGVSGGTGAGSNLFHRFGAFDTRGGITGVRIESGGYSNVMVGVINSLGSFIDKPISLSSKGNLFWLSPGGITISGSGGFQNVQHLNLSTATGLRIGSGLFDVLGTTPAQAALLSGEPLRGRSGLVTDPASLAVLGLSSNGDLSIDGGTLTVDQSLLLDAQGGNVIVQAARLLVSGGEIEVAGRDVSISASELNVSSPDGVGGRITVEGDTVSVRDSRLDASGATGGGTVVLAAVGDLTLENSEVLATGGDGDVAPSEPDGAGTAAAESTSEAGSDGSQTGGAETGGSETSTETASETSSETSAAAGTDASEAGADGASEGSTTATEPSSGAVPGASSDAVGPSGALVVAESGSGNSGPADAGSGDAMPSAPVHAALPAAKPPAAADGSLAEPVLANGGRIDLKGQLVLISGGTIDASGSGGGSGSTSGSVSGSAGTVVESSGTSGSWSFAPQSGTTDLNAALAEPPPDAVTVVQAPLLEVGVSAPLRSDVSALEGTGSPAAGLASAPGAASPPVVTAAPATPPPSGRGGQVTIAGGTVLQGGGIQSSGSSGGQISVVASQNIVSLAPIQAEGFTGEGGSITLQAGGNLVQTVNSRLQASGTKVGGSISVSAEGNVFSSGTYEAIGTGEQAIGGSIDLSAATLTLQAATADASGTSGGGTVHVGGGFQGAALTSGAANASTTTVSSTSVLKADALRRGDGGEVVVWSEQVTRFSGSVSARGGAEGGDGGLLEVSGKELLRFSGQADAGAPQGGAAGTLLLDPKNIVIDANPIQEQVGYGVTQLVDPNPRAGDQFGSSILVLPGGNIVALDPLDDFDPLVAVDTGAAYLFDGTTGALLSSLQGSTSLDSVGSGGAVSLGNGNYVILSSFWDNGTVAVNAGAVTWGDGSTGMSGVVGSANSLVGSSAGDGVGSNGVKVLGNGHYAVASPFWDSPATDGAVADVGAVTWGNGSLGIAGEISSLNSLVGSSANDRVGVDGITVLSNGNYVITSSDWNLVSTVATISGAGAVTWVDGRFGLTGVVSSDNSLVGSNTNDWVGWNSGNGVVGLANGNYLVVSSSWDRPSIADAGAVTWGNGTSGMTGFVGQGNSLVGSRSNDQIGSDGVIELTNGNFVVLSPQWDNTLSTLDVGAVTWGDGTGTTRLAGEVTESNSLVGSSAGDAVGNYGVTPLTNGNYVVSSPDWDGAAIDVGAVTWGNGVAGTSGLVSETNSLVGSSANDAVGFYGVTALANGNYVVVSSDWDDVSRTAINAGAVTWGDGDLGISGAVSSTNSLVGSDGDRVGAWGIGFTSSYQITELVNGNYVVTSSEWSGDGSGAYYGAVTWVNGSNGELTGAVPGTVGGIVASTNSLVGTSADDWLGNRGVVALETGNYVVISPNWDLDPTNRNVGAVTWTDGSTGGTVGAVGTQNSLTGGTLSDRVGSGGVVGLSNGNYLVSSPQWDLPFTSGALADVGAVTWVSGTNGQLLTGDVGGSISELNSLVGSSPFDRIGGGFDSVQSLSSGNAVVSSPGWDHGAVEDVGASTWIDGTSGLAGFVSSSNSLVGQTAFDAVGDQSIVVLKSGNYLVHTPYWANPALTSGSQAGAVTWVDAARGLTGVVSSSNSLVGDQAFSNYGGECSEGCASYLTPVAGDQFLVGSPLYDNGAASNVGLLQLVAANEYGYAVQPGGDMTLTPAQIEAIANRGTAVVLQANNDITLNASSDININNPIGTGGSLSLEAGRSILLNSSISTDGSDIRLLANQAAAESLFRDAGAAVITMAPGTSLNTGDAGTGEVVIQLSSQTLGSGVAGAVTLAAITAGRISVDAALGLTLTNSLTASAATGNSIVLGSGAGAFQNLSSSPALVVESGAQWLVYSSTPVLDAIGSLLPSFKQYNISFGDTLGILGTGNGFLYSAAPTLSVDLVGSVSRVYDASTQITLDPSNLSISGILGGDQIALSPLPPLLGSLVTKDVGTGKSVTLTGLTIDSVQSSVALGSVPVYGYQLASSTATGAIAEITPANLSVSGLIADNKVYDTTTTATLSGSAAVTALGSDVVSVG
ncbi:YDG domain-containing protein, partial [Synechococcus sp. CS-1328]|uniref:YDG domain-containing protein n=1 Tax=Synechococcus sp. CS-1328 TaxID=2847976 RepID=UPI00223A8000